MGCLGVRGAVKQGKPSVFKGFQGAVQGAVGAKMSKKQQKGGIS